MNSHRKNVTQSTVLPRQRALPAWQSPEQTSLDNPREEYQGTFARAFCREWPMKCNCLNLLHQNLPKINGNKTTKCKGQSLQNGQAICSARRTNKVETCQLSKNLEKRWKKSGLYKMQLPGWSEKYLATMGWTYKMLSYLKIDPEEKNPWKHDSLQTAPANLSPLIGP